MVKKKANSNDDINENLSKLADKAQSKARQYTGGNIVANAHLVERLNAQKSNKKEKQKK